VNARYDLPRTEATPAELAAALRDSYATTRRLVGDFTAEQWIGPYLPVVNPPLWETGHIAWFLERWVLRRAADAASFLANADALYDSSRIAHVARWFLPLPDAQQTLAYLARVTDAVLRLLDDDRIREASELYYVELSVYHQDMHNEAFRYMRQTWGYHDPLAAPAYPRALPGAAVEGDAAIPAGRLTLGSSRHDGFIFDNEKWAHEVDVPAFAIGRRLVSNREFLAFVEDGGYRRRELWDEPGWRWREDSGRNHPAYWRRGEGWQQRVFERWQPVELDLPVIHVSAYEAQAWCRWSGRRLPTEAEWERAAATAPGESVKRRYPWGDAPQDAKRANLDGAGLIPVYAGEAGDSAWGCRQMLGNVWQWTATPFHPYPGFAVDPYEDYSRPWFGSHRVLRGASFATKPRLARLGYRNFYTPDRADVFCGFRTCAL
jgi:ergothioneine biosynthesis protein EgtB